MIYGTQYSYYVTFDNNCYIIFEKLTTINISYYIHSYKLYHTHCTLKNLTAPVPLQLRFITIHLLH